MTEGKSVFLVVFVAQLSHVLVDDAVLFTEINDFHSYCRLSILSANLDKKNE